jgi:hypothetical protein
MRRARIWTVLAIAVLAAGALVSAAPAFGAVGRGTFTQVTTPTRDFTFNFNPAVTNSFHVAGVTSLDVAAVDIECVLFIYGQHPESKILASDVPVASGGFSTTAVLPTNPPTNCRLRAIPAGIDVEGGDYIGSFTGPLMYTQELAVSKSASVPYAFNALVEEGDGAALLTDASSCTASALVTVDAPQMVAGPILIGCGFALPPTNVGPSGPSNASATQVDGHNAYLPGGVHDLLITTQGLAVTQPALTVSRQLASNGDTTIAEAATLVRCSHSNTYPPDATSCPSLVSTGVRFSRVTEVFRNGHQIKIRDTFTSTDHHAHTLALQYQNEVVNEAGGSTATGDVGYSFPGHPNTFHAANLGLSVTGLGPKAGTMFVRSDLHARSDDPTADTVGETWSRGPSNIRFSFATTDQYGLAYAVAVPASGSATLGFAISERWSTADVVPLAKLAVADMLPGVSVTSPANGARIRGSKTHVSGNLTAGANGLPTAVMVNGHKATITVHSSTSASYAVRFSEPLGRHQITAAATDAAGNARSASISIRNIHKKKKKK